MLFPDKLIVGIQARANEAEKLPNHVQLGPIETFVLFTMQAPEA